MYFSLFLHLLRQDLSIFSGCCPQVLRPGKVNFFKQRDECWGQWHEFCTTRHQTSQRQMCQNQFQNLMKSVSSEIFWKLPVSQLPKKFWFMTFLFVLPLQYHFPKLVGALQEFACQPGRDWTLQPIINKCFHTFVSYSNSYSVSCFWKQKHLSWQPNSILHFTSCEKQICHRE